MSNMKKIKCNIFKCNIFKCNLKSIFRTKSKCNDIFSDVTLKNTPWFTLKDITAICKVVDVYDGDTITVAVEYCRKIVLVKVRLEGIDTPEKRTKDLYEKKIALKATKWLSDLILNKNIWVKFKGWGKYGGRMIGTLFLTSDDVFKKKSINDILIQKGIATPYFGKKKIEFRDWYDPNNDLI